MKRKTRKIICTPVQNQCEQDVVRDYCLNRELVRPNINILVLMSWLLPIEIAAFALTYVLYDLFHWFGIMLSFKILHLVTSVVMFLIFLKKICIVLIKLYQRYASDETRRKCTMMPSCSEYALLAMEKYNIFRALHKTYIRLTRKCRGSYVIDYP